jgi:hypothetical protein
MNRARAVAGSAVYWLLAPLVCLLVHWPAFHEWFRADDFAWLSLDQGVHSFHDVLVALFSPQAQGTIRPWSDRGFFMVGYAVFGLNPLPYRIVVFATQFANLALVTSIGRRLTGLRAAGVCAALLWSVNAASVQPLVWACVYNEVMCAFFLLLAFHFFLRHVETGARRYYVYQWIVFVLGFGAMEANVVYPALAVVYALFCARRYLWKTLAMVPVSIAYAVLHAAVASVPATGVYAPHWDFSMVRTLVTYWKWSLGPVYLLTPFHHVRHWQLGAGMVLLTLALGYFLFRQWQAGKRVAAFFLLWFPLLLAPELPLRDHVTEYYPFLALIGLCWLGGWGLAAGWHSGKAARAAAVALAAIYGLMATPCTVMLCRWNRDLTIRSLHLVEGVAGARQLHPDKAILLDGVDADLFWNAVFPGAFRLVGIDRVYLAGVDPSLREHPEWGQPDALVLAGDVTTRALANDEVEVYDVRGPRLRNITSAYARQPRERDLPRLIEAGDPLVAGFLGPEWYPIETNHRWMPRRATLRIGGPLHSGQSLHLRGNCTAEQLRDGPLTVTVTVDGFRLPPATVAATPFEAVFPLPDRLVGKPAIQVTIEVNRTVRPGSDVRDLGLAFGEIAVE